MPQGMDVSEIDKDVSYEAHASVLKEKSFVSKKPAEQLRAVHIAIFPLSKV